MAEKCPKIIKDMAERSTKILSRTEIKNSLLINSKCQRNMPRVIRLDLQFQVIKAVKVDKSFVSPFRFS